MMAQLPQNETVQQSQVQTTSVEDDPIEEIELKIPEENFYNKVYNMAERVAATRFGQFVIERGDRLLKMIEDTAKWSLPQDQFKGRLNRPFNWITFLMLIIALRMIRLTTSIGAVMIGNKPVSAKDMVYFIQTRRRKLRSIRVHGLKEIRRKEIEANAMRSGNSNTGIVGKIQAIVTVAICRPGQHREPERRVFVQRSQQEQAASAEEQNLSVERQTCKRPRDDEYAEHNLTFDELLTKYANENSDEDPDFLPNSDDENNDDSNSNASSSDEEEDEEESETNAEEITKKSKINDNDVLLVKENGGQNAMPKPMHDIKEEEISVSDSPKAPLENGPSDGDSHEKAANEQNDLSTPTPTTQTNNTILKSNLYEDLRRKSTPGHESAANIALKDLATVTTFGPTATAVPQNDANPNISTSFSYCIQSLSSMSLLTDELIRKFQILESATQKSNTRSQQLLCRSLSTTSLPIEELNYTLNSSSSSSSSASSTEDIFYSPIGSPSDFNVTFKPISILKNPIGSSTEIGEQGNDHSIPKSSDELEHVDSIDSSSHSTFHKKHVHHKQPNKQNHQYSRHQNKNRR